MINTAFIKTEFNQYIILPDWLSAHGDYILVAFLLMVSLLIYSIVIKNRWYTIFGWIWLILLLFIAPDSNEPHASNRQFVAAQLLVIIGIVVPLYVLILHLYKKHQK